MHSLLLLLHFVPKLLVESRPLSWSSDSAAIVPLACRHSRSAHRRASRPARRPFLALSLSYQDVPEGAQPGARDLPHQTNDGGARVNLVDQLNVEQCMRIGLFVPCFTDA